MASKPKGGRSARAEAVPRALASWDDVRFFLALHRAGSLSAASRPLGVSQPTCGRRLAALEASLRLRLFDRTPDGLRITEEGRALLDAAMAMERSAQDLALRAAVKDRDLEGIVRIATNELFACSFVVRALAVLRARYPAIRAELVIANTEADLLRREADIAFRFRPHTVKPEPAALVARKMGDEPFLLYAADDYLERRGAPADPNDLAGHDVVAFTAPHPAARWCEAAFRGANVVLSAPSLQVGGAAIAAGLGLGVLPRRALRVFPTLRPASPVIARGTGWLVMHPDLRDVPRIRVVADAFVQLFQSERPAGYAGEVASAGGG